MAVRARVAADGEAVVQPIGDQIARRHLEKVSKDAAAADGVVLVRHDDWQLVAELGSEEQAAYLEALGMDAKECLELGLSHRVLPTMVRQLLGLDLVYTGPGVPRENTETVKAHLVRRGSLTAEGLAGRLHGDILRGFVCAEVAPAAALLQHASYSRAKDAGCVRTEGRGYVLAPSDVVLVKWR